MPDVVVAGVDPGLSGAIALITSERRLRVWDMPTLSLSRGGKNKREIDVYALANILRGERIDHAFIEQVGSMPGQGVSSVFAFGKAFGIVIGVVSALGIPVTFVAPVKWKRAQGVTADKDGARARASQLMPGGSSQWPLVKHDGRAESALIAHYGMGTLSQLAA